jgi:hypothetical protein
MEGLTQSEKVLKHLQSGKTITPLEALGIYGVYRLGARIWDLRDQGHDIDKLMKNDGMGRTYAEYFLVT